MECVVGDRNGRLPKSGERVAWKPGELSEVSLSAATTRRRACVKEGENGGAITERICVA